MTKHIYIDDFGTFLGKTYTILCDNEKREKVKKLIDTIITMIKDQKIPASSASEYQCSQCEFLNYCNDRF